MADKERTQRTTLILDPKLHKRLRLLAIERESTFTAIVTEALTEYLERHVRQERRRKR